MEALVALEVDVALQVRGVLLFSFLISENGIFYLVGSKYGTKMVPLSLGPIVEGKAPPF
jgi:hypothetical protein